MTTETETMTLCEKYAQQVEGVLSCYDRVVVMGSLHPLCYAKGMSCYLSQHGIRLFDYGTWAQPKRDEIRANAEAMAQVQRQSSVAIAADISANSRSSSGPRDGVDLSA